LTAAAAATAHPIWAVALAAPTVFLISFFRDPERHPPGGPDTIVSPADGTVLSVGPAAESPAGASRRITIFMSVFNVHVNRSPISGVLDGYTYSPGKKLAAFSEKSSLENEQNLITVRSPAGVRVAFKQIAGLLARRIIFYPRTGDVLERGRRVGIILFGSRVDLFVPDGAEILVLPGQRTRAGATPLARLADPP
jgi:phosphatidylserine decarboxylase